jgi:hypothetical protein
MPKVTLKRINEGERNNRLASCNMNARAISLSAVALIVTGCSAPSGVATTLPTQERSSMSIVQRATTMNALPLVGYWDGWQKNNLDDTPTGITTIPIAFGYLHGHSVVMTEITAGYVTASDIASLHSRGIKVTLSIGGASPSNAFTFDGNVSGFESSLKSLIAKLPFDGVDLDDESGTESSRISDLTTLIPAARDAFNAMGMSDAIVTYPAWNKPDDNGDAQILGNSSVASSLSWVNVMSYQHADVAATESDLEAYGAIFPKSKLMMGVDIVDKPTPTTADLQELSSWVRTNSYGGMMAWTVNTITAAELQALQDP